MSDVRVTTFVVTLPDYTKAALESFAEARNSPVDNALSEIVNGYIRTALDEAPIAFMQRYIAAMLRRGYTP